MDYRREIDGLRALAVAPVVLFHAGFEAFSGGFVGVDVFFVISGYLITSIILAELRDGKFSIISFYDRRARRILPALLLVLLVSIILSWLWLLPSAMKDFSLSLVAVSFFASNILFWRESGYFDTAAELKPLLHTWSLAVEEQYYLLFPLFLMSFWRLGKRWIVVLLGLAFAISFALAQWGSYANPSASFYLLPTRGWELLMGAFSAFYLSNAERRSGHIDRKLREIGAWLGLALIIFAVFSYSKATPFPGAYALAPTVGTTLIILFATHQTAAGMFIGNRVFVGIGLISYSTYLWHQPLFAFARQRTLAEPSHLAFLALSTLALVMGYLSWRFVEAPFRNRVIFSRKYIIFITLFASSVFVAFGLLGYFNGGFKGRVPTTVLGLTTIEEEHRVIRGDGGCNLFKQQTKSRECIKGHPSIAPTFALLGDSHASTIAYELDRFMLKEQKSFIQFTKNGCPAALTFKDNNNEDCGLFVSNTLESLSKTAIDTIIISSRWSYYLFDDDFNNSEGGIEKRANSKFTALNVSLEADASFRRKAILTSYKLTIEKLLASGKRLILIYPVPEQGWDVPRIAAKRLLSGRDNDVDISVNYSMTKDRNRDIIDLLDSLGESDRLIRIRPFELFCDTFLVDRCVAYFNGESFYYDSNHLSNAGARLIVEKIFSIIE